MAAIYSNGGNRWNILGFNFTKRDALSSVYKISMVWYPHTLIFFATLHTTNHNLNTKSSSDQHDCVTELKYNHLHHDINISSLFLILILHYLIFIQCRKGRG